MAVSEDLDYQLIKKRLISGIITFTLRTFFIQIFTFFATFLLTIVLEPKIFGIFFVVSAILNLFVYFSDIGLAAALIQKKTSPTKEDLTTTFIIQQIIVITLVIVGLFFSANIAHFFNLDNQGLLLLRTLIFSLFLSSLKTIPSIILERNLNFTRLVIPQVAENLIFYSVAVTLAFLNFGLASFIWATLARGIAGLILIYILSPWKPSFSFNVESIKTLIRFGIPFQLNSVLALIKDDLLTVFIGKLLPYNEVGYIGWAQRFSFLPLRFIMDNVIKVSFPAYSRLQENKEKLSHAIEKSIFFVTFLVYPAILGTVAIAPTVINIIPGYSKWEPALPLLYLFSLNAIFAAVNTTLTNTLFAIGKPKIILYLMVFWTILNWSLTFIFVKNFGYIGVALASAIVAASTSVTIYFVKREVKLSILKNIYLPAIASFMMLLVLRLLDPIFPDNLFGIIVMIISGILIYSLISLAVLGKKIIEDVNVVLKVFFNKTRA